MPSRSHLVAAASALLGSLVSSCSSSPPAVENDEPRSTPPARPESTILPAHLAYLEHIAEAERQLLTGDVDGAARAATAALEQPVETFYDVPMFGQPRGNHAAAHFFLACARAATDAPAAFDSLRAAATAGWSDKDRVESDSALASLRAHPSWSEVLDLFREEDATDDLAGVTVEDRDDGMRVVIERMHNFPKLGESAPDFEAKLADESGVVRLSDLYRDRPVALVFGSFT